MDRNDLTDFSDYQKDIIMNIIKGDRSFHTEAMFSILPFEQIAEQSEDGIIVIRDNVFVILYTNGENITVTLRFSKEQNCWFFKCEFGGEEYNGIIHLNTVCNPKGVYSFCFLSDNASDTTEDITQSLRFCNFMVLRK